MSLEGYTPKEVIDAAEEAAEGQGDKEITPAGIAAIQGITNEADPELKNIEGTKDSAENEDDKNAGQGANKAKPSGLTATGIAAIRGN